MAVLRTLVVALLATAACYSPDVRDCTVSCTSAVDCAAHQVCGADRFCAAPEVAGSCAEATVDAGSDAKPGKDAKQPDDAQPDAPPDAAPDASPPTIQLHIRIEGRGSVTVPDVGTCDGGSGGTDCLYAIPQSVAISLHALPKNQWQFRDWDSAACAGEPATCVLTPALATYVKARFELIDDDIH